jgi:histidinol-phosphate/aromatic aminotransferase/cobyric acid decarboxylase-like protein
LRITIGTAEECELIAEALERFMADQLAEPKHG